MQYSTANPLRYPNVMWRAILYDYLFTTELYDTPVYFRNFLNKQQNELHL